MRRRPNSGAVAVVVARARHGRRVASVVLVALAGPLLCLAATGCARGIRWRGYSYEPVHAESRKENKLTFVYFRSWYRVECTDFEEKVLKDPQVLAATADLNCAALDYDWDTPLAEQWGISKAPAYAIVDPAGELLAGSSGYITLEALLRAIADAKAVFARHEPDQLPP